MKTDQSKKQDGLPEIAQRLKQRRPVVLAVVAVIFIACLSLFFVNKPKKKIAPAMEETYTVQSAAQSDTSKTSPVLAESTSNDVSNTNQLNSADAQERSALIEAKRDELRQRLSAPLMLVNNAQSNKAEVPSQQSTPSGDHNTEFMSQVATQGSEVAVATSIGSLNTIIAQGSLIHAILEPATNSDLPGYVRAIVSEPSYSEDGTALLIPEGSRLIGQYKSGMLQGQTRIFMVWTRLITPTGISIQLGSPGVDSLGVAGMEADEIDNHFWARFGTGSLLSIIGIGAANAGVSATDQENSASLYRTAVANSFAQSANQSLQQDGRIPPTLKTFQGKPIMVFVAKDLSFKNAIKLTKPNVNLF